MAEQVRIAAAVRDETGKGPARRLRASGRVPGIVYGADVGSTKVHVDALDLFHALHTSAGGNVLIRISVDGDEYLTIPREVQRHPVRGDLLHVDFVAFDRDSLVRVEVPVHLEGVDEVSYPAVVQHVLHTVPIRVRPLDIPDNFTLDVSEMVIGDVLRVEDVALPEGAEFDIEEERTVVTVTAPTVLEEPEEEEEPGIPEELASLMEAGGLPSPVEAEEGLVASPEELREDVKGEQEQG